MIFMNYYLEEEPPQCSHLLDANNIRSRKMRALSDCDASISGGTSLQPSFGVSSSLLSHSLILDNHNIWQRREQCIQSH